MKRELNFFHLRAPCNSVISMVCDVAVDRASMFEGPVGFGHWLRECTRPVKRGQEIACLYIFVFISLIGRVTAAQVLGGECRPCLFAESHGNKILAPSTIGAPAATFRFEGVPYEDRHA